MDPLLPALEDDGLAHILNSLRILASSPPQSLFIEGGSEAQRLQLGQYWAMLANCPSAMAAKQASGMGGPCLECPVCRKISAMEFSDLFIFDGRISNAEDEEKPGLIRSLRMENIRDLKVILGSSPNGDGKRLVLIQGMTAAREEAMNSLLKILEEPSRSTLFVLLASQRSQILPTLVSRSICLTLPWADCLSLPSQDLPLLEELCGFFHNGRGFLDKIMQKGALDNAYAAALLLECQKALSRVMTGKKTDKLLDARLRPLADKPESVALAHAWMNEAHVLLQASVAPARVLEAFACRLYELLHP